MKKYILNILISFDQLLNTFLFGDPDETISSRAYKIKDNKLWAKYLMVFLEWIDPGHGEKYVEHDEGDDAL